MRIKSHLRKLDIRLHGLKTIKFAVEIPENLSDEDLTSLIMRSVETLENEASRLAVLWEEDKHEGTD